MELQFIIPENPKPRWADAAKTAITCMVIFPSIGETAIPHTALASAPEGSHSKKIFDIFLSGDLEIEVAEYVPDEPVPVAISDRQFADELKARGIITHSERMAFVKVGDLPPVMSEILSKISKQEDREDAESLVSGSQEFHRNHPLTEIFAAGLGMTSNEIDDFFRAASKR